jgi:hypothetical protein
MDHLVEHRLEHPGMFEPNLITGQVDVAVDRNPVRPVLDGQVADAERLALVREERNGLDAHCETRATGVGILCSRLRWPRGVIAF